MKIFHSLLPSQIYYELRINYVYYLLWCNLVYVKNLLIVAVPWSYISTHFLISHYTILVIGFTHQIKDYFQSIIFRLLIHNLRQYINFLWLLHINKTLKLWYSQLMIILNNCNKFPCNRFQKVSKIQTSIMNVVKYIYLSQHVPSYAVLCMHDWLKLIITNKYIFQFRSFVSSEKCQSNLLRQFRGSNAYSPRPALVYFSFGFKQL